MRSDPLVWVSAKVTHRNRDLVTFSDSKASGVYILTHSHCAREIHRRLKSHRFGKALSKEAQVSGIFQIQQIKNVLFRLDFSTNSFFDFLYDFSLVFWFFAKVENQVLSSVCTCLRASEKDRQQLVNNDLVVEVESFVSQQKLKQIIFLVRLRQIFCFPASDDFKHKLSDSKTVSLEVSFERGQVKLCQRREEIHVKKLNPLD